MEIVWLFWSTVIMIDAVVHACNNSFNTHSDRTKCTASNPVIYLRISETVVAIEMVSVNP